jgi:hypothetical protein
VSVLAVQVVQSPCLSVLETPMLAVQLQLLLARHRLLAQLVVLLQSRRVLAAL